ncbi:MAG TPA: glycosyltransferase [Ramlibacter sp.]|nr:glycosyltransferase [Ramlibacter sp.]
MSRLVYVPTLVDSTNHNAQVLNARAILAGWDAPGWQVAANSYGEPDPRVAANAQVHIARLWRRHAWRVHYLLRYLRPYGLVFYPGVTWMDVAGMRWRGRLGMSAPVVATLEGLVGDAAREADYTSAAAHPVYCHHVPNQVLRCVDAQLSSSDHVIAISPFLARMGERRYGRKFSTLPLGVDTGTFFPTERPANPRPRVVCVGSLTARKRPELFSELARLHPWADFFWYGEGPKRAEVENIVQERNLKNLSLPGPLPPERLADALRNADVFVLPSKSEGVPKVTQEAAACGLPQVIFGHYEAPTVIDQRNGFVVWNDEAFFEKAGELIDNPALAAAMGRAGAEMARAWDWALVAPQWRARLLEIAERQ